MSAALSTVFFLSGVSALLFETLWFRQAGLTLGNSIWASSLVLAAFMGGLGVGNGLAGWRGDRIRSPLRLYAVLEGIIAVSGVALVLVLPLITPLLVPVLRSAGGDLVALNGLRVAVGFALMLIPSAAMGATLPLLVTALFRRDPRFGAVLGRLYGWNTLGAVAGAVLGEALLIGWFGIRGTALVAALLNGIAAAVALRLARSAVAAAGAHTSTSARPLTARAWRLLGAAFLSGAAFLALEVVWFRFLLLSVSGTSLAFALMLAVVLAGIGTGGLLGSRWLSWRPRAHVHASALALAGGSACVATYALFDVISQGMSERTAHTAWETIALAAPLMLPPSLLSGMLFTVLGEAVERESPHAARSAGFLTLANTLGAMLGSLAAGFLLLPELGIERSLAWLAASYALTGLLALPASFRAERPPKRVAIPLLIAAALLLAALLFFPRGFMAERYLTRITDRFVQFQPALVREALTETIIYLRRDLFGELHSWRLITNSHSMSSTSIRDQRYMTLFVYWPIALRPETQSALLISYGIGVTASALTDTASLTRIDVVDISADIMESNRIVRQDADRGYPLDDPRVRVHVEDGRHFLQTTDLRFDLITGEPPPPKLAGIVSLYTQEYFSLVRDHLNDGGITTYWLPVNGLLEGEAKAILRAFCSVFENCSLWTGTVTDWVMIGSRGALARATTEGLSRQWRDPVVGPRLERVGLESPAQLGSLFLAGPAQLARITADTPPLDDDHPKRLSDFIPHPQPFIRSWTAADTARERFLESEWLQALWPEEMFDASLRSFDDQHLLNRTLFHELGDFVSSLPALHRLLVQTDLRTLPVWMLGSDASAERAAFAAFAAGRRGLGIDFHRAIAALADRDYTSAADLFRSARLRPLAIDHPDLLYHEIYSLALAGRDAAARMLMAKGRLEPAFRVFVGEQFPDLLEPPKVVTSPSLGRE